MRRLELLDYARFIAAVCVICFHYYYNGIKNGKINSFDFIPGIASIAQYGYLGVEFFFMISGYVIFFSAKERTSNEFIVSRLTRLYPAFWSGVLITSICVVFMDVPRLNIEISQFFANLTMIPRLLGEDYVDGVYWTLQFELWFYVLVFIILFLGFQNKLESIFIIWPFIMFVSTFLKIDHIIFLGGYYSYFAAGGIFAIIKHNKERNLFLKCLALFICFILCVKHSAVNIFSLRIKTADINGYIIILVLLFFNGFFFFLNTNFGSTLKLKGSKFMGGLTYPLYLVHAHVGYVILSKYGSEDNKYLLYLITFLIVVFIAAIIHDLVEKKMRILWRYLFEMLISRAIKSIEYIMNRLLASGKLFKN